MEQDYLFTWFYPGDAYVDIVAGTKYDDQLIVPDYAELQRFNKVVAMGEFGTRTDSWHDCPTTTARTNFKPSCRTATPNNSCKTPASYLEKIEEVGERLGQGRNLKKKPIVW